MERVGERLEDLYGEEEGREKRGRELSFEGKILVIHFERQYFVNCKILRSKL